MEKQIQHSEVGSSQSSIKRKLKIFFSIIWALFFLGYLYQYISVLRMPMLCDDSSCLTPMYILVILPLIIFLVWKPSSRNSIRHFIYGIGVSLVWIGILYGLLVTIPLLPNKKATIETVRIPCPPGTDAIITSDGTTRCK